MCKISEVEKPGTYCIVPVSSTLHFQPMVPGNEFNTQPDDDVGNADEQCESYACRRND